MFKQTVVVALIVAILAPAVPAAQDGSEPYKTLVAFRQQYPSKMTAEQRGELLNRVAWKYRDSGMRLLGKRGGENCPMPNGIRISCDYLVDGPTMTGFDVLSGRDDGTTATVEFTWGGPGKEPLAAAVAAGERTILDAVLPDSTEGPTQPSGDGGGSGGVVTLPPGTGAGLFDVAEIIRRQMVLENELLIVKAEARAAAAVGAETLTQVKEHRANVSKEYYKWAAILTPLATGLVVWVRSRLGVPVPGQ